MSVTVSAAAVADAVKAAANSLAHTAAILRAAADLVGPALPAPPKKAADAFAWAAGEKERISLLPIRHADIWKFRKVLDGLHWNAQEVDLIRDKYDWDNCLTKDERYFVKMQLAFFAGADLWVLANLGENFIQEIDCMEAKFVFAAQEDQECTHTESYGLQIEAVLGGEERDQTLNAARHMPAVEKMRDWALGWFDRAIPIGERLVAWAIFEGVLFSASFASLQWLREKNLLPGITQFNTFISRDEGVHTEHTCLYVRKYLRERPAFARVKEIFDSAIVALDEFVSESLPVRLIGMNETLMSQYVRFQADCVALIMGYEAVYDMPNPFPFMDKLSLNAAKKTNFFEHRATEYQTPTGAGDARFAVDDTPFDKE